MHRPHDLGHHGEAALAGKLDDLFLLVADELGNGRDAGCRQQVVDKAGRDVAVLPYPIDDATYAGHVDAVHHDVLVGGLGRLHHLRQGGGQRHLVAEVYVAALQKLLHLGAGRADAGQDGEYRLAALAYLLVEHVVDFEYLHQARRAEDDHDGIYLREPLLAVVDGQRQLLGAAGSQDVNGIADTTAGQQLRLQLVGSRARQRRNIHAALRQGVGQHHAGAAGMGDDGEVDGVLAAAAQGLRQTEDAADGRQFLARETAHDAGLAEQGLDSRVARGDGSRMTRRRPTAALRRACLDGGYPTALANERGGVVEHLVGVGNVLDVEQLHQRVVLGVEVLVHILQHALDAYLMTVTDRPYTIESQSFSNGTFKNEYSRGAAA